MARRTLALDPATITARLREHMERGLTPERSAGELEISMSTWHRYLRAAGLCLVTDRRICHSVTNICEDYPSEEGSPTAAGGLAGDSGAPDHHRRPGAAPAAPASRSGRCG